MVRGTAEVGMPGSVGIIIKGAGLMLGNAQMTEGTAPDRVVVT